MAVRVDRYGRKITEPRRLHKVIETARRELADCHRNTMKKFEGAFGTLSCTIPRRISFAMNERHVICKWPLCRRNIKKATRAAKILFGDEFRANIARDLMRKYRELCVNSIVCASCSWRGNGFLLIWENVRGTVPRDNGDSTLLLILSIWRNY